MPVPVSEMAPSLARHMTETFEFVQGDIRMMAGADDFDDPVVQAILQDLTRTARRLQSLAAALAALT